MSHEDNEDKEIDPEGVNNKLFIICPFNRIRALRKNMQLHLLQIIRLRADNNPTIIRV